MRYSSQLIAILLVVLCAIACEDYASVKVERNVIEGNKDVASKTKSELMDNEYEVSPNPYSLSVMQAVYDEYSTSPVNLSPTDYYVRVMPHDSLQMEYLLYESGLELFDYPLDIELAEGTEYIDSTIVDEPYPWLYTTVSPDYSFPSGYEFEILDRCYIPEEGEVIVQTKAGDIDVEEAAYSLLGYNLEEEIEPITRTSSVKPSGTITVVDDFNNEYPVKGVRVRGHRFVKYSIGYTDDNGHYELRSGFRNKLRYEVVFANKKGFDIWGGAGPFALAKVHLGKGSATGKTKKFTSSDEKGWRFSAVNNGGYDYYEMCEVTGIPKPPENLKVWCWGISTGSSAPMVRRLKHAIGFNSSSAWANFFVNIGYGLSATLLNMMYSYLTPDITIGTKDPTYERIYRHTNHEMSHASHFSSTGSAFWAKYVSYIMTYGAYGDGTGNNAELCGIGEMWGYSVGIEQARANINSTETVQTVGGWIKPQVFDTLVDNNIFSRKQVFDCLVPEVRTYNSLVEKMYALYPDKADVIEEAFLRYNVPFSVKKPQYGDVMIRDTVFTASNSYQGEKIVAQDVSVKNGATLSLTGTVSTTLLSEFVIEKGSNLLIFKQ